jgi:hypothetical protein
MVTSPLPEVYWRCRWVIEKTGFRAITKNGHQRRHRLHGAGLASKKVVPVLPKPLGARSK